MKVFELMKQLSYQKPEDDVVMKHLYTDPEVIMKKIRVYALDGRVIVDGYEQERFRDNDERR